MGIEIIYIKWEDSMANKSLQLEGKRFGRLLVVKKQGRDVNYNSTWEYICDCGKAGVTRGYSLTRGRKNSCGCLIVEANTKHNHAHSGNVTKTYKTWAGLKKRCLDKSDKDYGGRGITVCDKWLKFEGFLEDMGEKPEGMSIERNNNNKGYSKDNCTWATVIEQANNKRNNTFYEVNGLRKTLFRWAVEYGIPPKTLWARVNRRGWLGEKSLTPVK